MHAWARVNLRNRLSHVGGGAMRGDLVSFKMLVASSNDAERVLLRECAAKAAFPVDCTEAHDPNDASGICRSVAQAGFDFIFVDSRLSKDDRKPIYQAALSSSGRPLVMFMGPADLATQEVMQADATADGVLARPFDAKAAASMINACARARLPKQVLVVDDSSNVRTVVRKVLQTSRFRLEIAEAADAASAVEQAASRHFDIVLLDCNMPGIDSFATLDQLKREHQDLHVVMTASTRDARLDDRARAAGADDFLFKPFYANDIDATLRRLLGLVPR